MEQKAEHLHIRASQHEKSMLAQAALAKNMSVSQFILQTTVPIAEEIIRAVTPSDQTLFRLEPKEWEEFNRLLDAPVRQISELRKLMQTKAPWEE